MDGLQIGNKARNLLELQNLVNRAGVQRWVRVPALHVIDHAAVWAHVHGSPGFADSWRGFVRVQPRAARQLTAEACCYLSTLRQCLMTSYVTGVPPDVRQWVAARSGVRLMVRSSSHEDGDNGANAGGNDSVANVAPEPVAVGAAMGAVIASYFSDKSLQQRLLAGDDITEPPCLAVLLQEMVGERRGGSIPVSGVMFTTEVEGPTPGVAHIQATYGHNEAVVSSGLPCDSYYVDATQQHCVVRPKMQRLVPRHNGMGLRATENPTSLRYRRALPRITARRLGRLGSLISAHFGRPMDVEWTYDPATHVIALLQARPLVTPETAPPSHVPAIVAAATGSIAGCMVGCGGGTVRVLTQPEQIIVAAELSHALQLYLQHPQRDAVQAVVVGGPAEATSHEAITLRGAGIPVLEVEDVTAVQTLVSQGEPLLLDAGRGLLMPAAALLAGRPRDVPVEEWLREREMIVPGWSEHPLPMRCSIFDEAPPAGLREVWQQLQELAATQPAVQLPKGPHRMRQLLAALQEGPRLQRPAILWEVWQFACKLTDSLQSSQALAGRAAALLRAVAAQMQPILEAKDPLRFLYAINWLRAVFLQPNSTQVVQGDSFATLLADWRTLRRRLSYASVPPKAQAACQQVGERALRAELTAAWDCFVLGLHINCPQLHEPMLRLLMQLQELGITDAWLHSAFPSLFRDHPQPRACFEAMQRAMAAPATRQACQWAQTERRVLETWRTRLGSWGAGKNLWGEFEPAIAALCGPRFAEMATLFDASDTVGKLSLLTWMDELVSLYDATIKSVTGSQIPAPAKAQLLHLLLGPFIDLLDNMAQLSGLAAYGASRFRGAQVVSLVRQCHQRVDGLEDPQRAAAQLLPSPQFNGAAAQLGNGVDASQHQPRTLEDLFTLTHQSLIGAQGALLARHGLQPAQLPPRIEQICVALCGTQASCDARDRESAAMRLTGVHYTYPHLKVDLNMPLREHSLQVRISYDATMPNSLQARVRMTGAEEHNRAERSMLYAGLYARGLGIAYASGGAPSLRNRVTQWRWDVPAARADAFCNTLRPLLAAIAHTTFGEETFDNVVRRVRRLTPSLELSDLDEAFFYQHPWYNHRFSRKLRDKAALLAVIRAAVRSPPGLCKVNQRARADLADDLERFLRYPALQELWRQQVSAAHRQQIVTFFAGHGSRHLAALACM